MSDHTLGKSLNRLRRGILLLLVAALVGTGAELLLMGHTEGLDQLIPLLLIGLGLVTLAWVGLAGSQASLRVFQGIMVLAIVSGAVGTLLHYRGNVEFEIESMPGLKGFDLFKEAMHGATPALAPGTMVLIGALGLLYTLGHPRLSSPPHQQTEES
jgi:hypothetical protein